MMIVLYACGSKIWHTESRLLTTRDYRLFDIQHAVVATTLPLDEFYRELVRTQALAHGASQVARNRAELAVMTAAVQISEYDMYRVIGLEVESRGSGQRMNQISSHDINYDG